MEEYGQTYGSSEEEVEKFSKGMKVFNKKVYPNHEHLASVAVVGKEDMTKELSKESERTEISATAGDIARNSHPMEQYMTWVCFFNQA